MELAEPTIQERLKQIDEIHALVLQHDEFFKKVDADALMSILTREKEMEDFKKVGKMYIKLVGVIAGFLGALYVLKQFSGSLIRFLSQ